jgi:hypothetical protein
MMSTRPGVNAANPQRPAAFLPRHTVRLAAHLLPDSPARDRYRQEFVAELYGMRRGRQVRHALGVLSRSFALRRAVTGAPTSLASEVAVTALARKNPLRCRLNIRHKWQEQRNPEGQHYFRCARCGKDRYDMDGGGGPNIGPQTGGFG